MTDMTKLAASNTEVPASDYVITGLKTLQGREGTAYTAKVRKGKRVIADLLQDGNGGELRIYFASREDEAEFNEFVKLWDGMTWGITEFSPEGFPFKDAEDVLDFFVMDQILLKELKRASKTKFLFIKAGESPENLHNIITKLTYDHPNLKEILANFPEVALYWNGEGWVEI